MNLKTVTDKWHSGGSPCHRGVPCCSCILDYIVSIYQCRLSGKLGARCGIWPLEHRFETAPLVRQIAAVVGTAQAQSDAAVRRRLIRRRAVAKPRVKEQLVRRLCRARRPARPGKPLGPPRPVAAAQGAVATTAPLTVPTYHRMTTSSAGTTSTRGSRSCFGAPATTHGFRPPSLLPCS